MMMMLEIILIEEVLQFGENVVVMNEFCREVIEILLEEVSILVSEVCDDELKVLEEVVVMDDFI